MKSNTNKSLSAKCRHFCLFPRRNRRVICPTYFNLYHYAGNNPVRYVDPDGRITRDEESQAAVDKLGTGVNLSVSVDMKNYLDAQGMQYIGSDSEAVQNANEDLKLLAADETTMVESSILSKTVTETESREKNPAEQMHDAKGAYFNGYLGAKSSTVQERNFGETFTEARRKIYSIRVYYASNIDSSTGKVCPQTFKTFVDVNDDGNIDFIAYGFRGWR